MLATSTVLLTIAFLSSQQWQLSEDLRIGAHDGEEALTAVNAIAVCPERRLAVAQRMSGTIRMYDADTGEYLFSMGRKGAGPGEFRTITALSTRGDTLVATDMTQSRAVLFSTVDGTHIRTARIASAPLEETRRSAVGYAITPDGLYWGRSSASGLAVANNVVTRVPILVMNEAGEIKAKVGFENWEQAISTAVFGGTVAVFRQPLVKRFFTAISQDGAFALLAQAPEPTSDESGVFRVIKVTHEADTLFSRSYRYRPQGVPKGLRRSTLSGFVKTFGSGVDLRTAKAAAEEFVVIPKYMPPLSEMLAGNDGSTWLRRMSPVRDSPDTWIVLDGRGKIVGTAVSPPGAVLLSATMREAWGVIRDEWDVPYVVRYRVLSDSAPKPDSRNSSE